VLPRLAPCLLMSPLAAAQLLDPALPAFDVVVFEEAAPVAMPLALAPCRGGRPR